MAAVSMQYTAASLRNFREFLATLRGRFVPALRSASAGGAVMVAEALNEHVKEQFVRGTDKHGQSHNKTGYTLGRFHVEPHALGAFVVGEGGALLVEDGSRKHPIDAKATGWLMFSTFDGGFVKTKHVDSPGYRGDPYVERAIAETDLEGFAVRVVAAGYAALLLRATGARP